MKTSAFAQTARRIFGDTDRASGVPDAPLGRSPLENVVGQRLADVFGIWDAHQQEWVSYAPLLLRFEFTDLLLQPSVDGRRVHAAVGSVPTHQPVTLAHPTTPEEASLNQELCLQWTRCADLTDLMGTRATLACLNEGNTALIRFEDGTCFLTRNCHGFLEAVVVERPAGNLRSA